MRNHVLVYLETVLVAVHDLRQTCHRLIKSFWTHPMVLLGDEAQVKVQFDLFGDSANLDTR
jgi:predicted secreted protein